MYLLPNIARFNVFGNEKSTKSLKLVSSITLNISHTDKPIAKNAAVPLPADVPANCLIFFNKCASSSAINAPG
tara:strand:- start:63 stop:281 length:219 start_codon:yes stop_codon:yes gene_type:complete